jgi:hypothetical protein
MQRSPKRQSSLSLIFLVCGVVGLFVTACASAAPTATPVPTTVPAPTQPPVVIPPTITPTRVADFKDYVLSDPSIIGTTGRPQMVVFIALKDTASQEMRPIIHALQDEYGTMVDFVYLDADDAKTEAIRKKLAFAGQKPTLIFLDAQGTEKARLTGKQTRDPVEGQVEDLLAVGG